MGMKKPKPEILYFQYWQELRCPTEARPSLLRSSWVPTWARSWAAASSHISPGRGQTRGSVPAHWGNQRPHTPPRPSLKGVVSPGRSYVDAVSVKKDFLCNYSRIIERRPYHRMQYSSLGSRSSISRSSISRSTPPSSSSLPLSLAVYDTLKPGGSGGSS